MAPSVADDGRPRTDVARAEPQPFALVELFTSEGCSSCPPADANLARLDREARAAGTRVFVLSMHVDYWDDLGWRDPFSRSAATQRQRRYAVSRDWAVYTPELVVNGTEQLLGSDAAASTRSIERALREPASAGVAVKLERVGPSRVSVDWSVATKQVAAGWVLGLALVARPEPSHVARGENAGRRLSHVAVVRAMASVPLVRGETHGKRELGVDGDWGMEPEVVAWVERGDLRVVGAARVGVP